MGNLALRRRSYIEQQLLGGANLNLTQGRTLKVLVFVAVLSLLAADISVGCGKGAYVYGPVEQKFVTSSNEPDRTILISGQPYDVPRYFYDIVSIGDWVRFNGRTWSIVKRADGSVPPKVQSIP